MTYVPDPAEVRAADRERLAVYEAVSSAISRREEVLRVCYGARNGDEAVAAIARLFDLSDQAARAVMDLQFRRLTQSDRGAINDQIREMRQRLQE